MTIEQPRRLGSDEVARRLEATMVLIPAYALEKTDAVLRGHPAEGEWCAKECLVHLAKGDRGGFGGFIRGVLTRDDFSFPPNGSLADPDEPLVGSGTCDRSIDDVLNEFLAARGEAVELLRRLEPQDLVRTGVRFGNSVPIGQVMQGWTGHDRAHFRQLLLSMDAVERQSKEATG